MILSFNPPCQYYIISFFSFFIHPGNLFRSVLQVAIHHYYPFPRCMLYAGSDSIMLTKISTKFNSFYFFVCFAFFYYFVPGVVGASIVYQDDFIIRSDCFNRTNGLLYQYMYNCFCFINRAYDREEGHGYWLDFLRKRALTKISNKKTTM